MTARFDAVRVRELSATLDGPPVLVAKAAFVSLKTGNSHGWTTREVWSPRVFAKLAELRALLEEELHGVHFDGGPAAPGGLAEHLAPSGDPPNL